MDPAEFIRTINRITLGYPLKAWGAYVEARLSAHGEVVVTVGFTRDPHRDTGEPGPAMSREMMPAWLVLQSYQPPLDLVLGMFRKILHHELLESLHVDGVRILDPHGEQAQP